MMQKGIIREKYGIEVKEVDALLESATVGRDQAIKLIDSLEYQDEADRQAATERANQDYAQVERYCAQFKEIRFTDQPQDGDDTTGYIPYYEEVEGFIIQKWEDRENDPTTIYLEIGRLKVLLQEGDYKVQKNAEYLALGAEPPYDLMELHTTRQAWRDRINELEVLLATLEENNITQIGN